MTANIKILLSRSINNQKERQPTKYFRVTEINSEMVPPMAAKFCMQQTHTVSYVCRTRAVSDVDRGHQWEENCKLNTEVALSNHKRMQRTTAFAFCKSQLTYWEWEGRKKLAS